jgi:hypothetical protein
MSAASYVPLPSAPVFTNISLDDPRLLEPISLNPHGDAYSKLPTYEGLIFDSTTGTCSVRPDLDPRLTADTESVAQALLDAGMIGKANSLVACERLIRQGPHCDRGDHVVPWVIRCALNLLCSDCGSRQGRLRRMARNQPEAYNIIVNSDLKLLTFTIPLKTAAADAAEAVARRALAREAFARFYRKLKARQGSGEFAMEIFDIVDPKACSVSFYAIYIGDCMPVDYRALWSASAPIGSKVRLQSCKGELTPEVSPSTRATRSRISSKAALEIAQSGLEPVLRLPAVERISYAVAFDGLPLSTPYGQLRGLDDRPQGNPECCDGHSDDGRRTDPAPYGYCPTHVERPLKFDPTAPLRTRSEFRQAWPNARFRFVPMRSTVTYRNEPETNCSRALSWDSPPPRFGLN